MRKPMGAQQQRFMTIQALLPLDLSRHENLPLGFNNIKTLMFNNMTILDLFMFASLHVLVSCKFL